MKKKSHARKPDPTRLFRAKQKGRRNELRFRHILSDPLNVTPWITKIEDAGREDDWENGIDFFVHTSTGWQIPVDVKSSYQGFRKHISKHGSTSVCIVIMKDNFDDDTMRAQIIDILSRWQEEAIKRGMTPTTNTS